MDQIIYISTARSEPTPQSIEHILRISRWNNKRDELTGLLIVGGKRFLQVLEGPRHSLDAAYRRIGADARHFALVQLSRKPIITRSFPDWEMGYQAGPDADTVEDLVKVVARLTRGVDDPFLRAELNGFAALHSRAA